MRLAFILTLLAGVAAAQITPANSDVRLLGTPAGQLPHPAAFPHYYQCKVGTTTTWSYLNYSPSQAYMVAFVATLHPTHLLPPYTIPGTDGPIKSYFYADSVLTPLSAQGLPPFDATWKWRWFPPFFGLGLSVSLPADPNLVGVQWYYEGIAHRVTTPTNPPTGLPTYPLGHYGLITIVP